jgi:hypothetical protein
MEPYKLREHFALALLVHTGTCPLSLWQSKHAALKSKARTDAPRPAGEGGSARRRTARPTRRKANVTTSPETAHGDGVQQATDLLRNRIAQGRGAGEVTWSPPAKRRRRRVVPAPQAWRLISCPGDVAGPGLRIRICSYDSLTHYGRIKSFGGG